MLDTHHDIEQLSYAATRLSLSKSVFRAVSDAVSTELDEDEFSNAQQRWLDDLDAFERHLKQITGMDADRIRELLG